MARLKQAKEEAETEVAEHKASTEHGFQRKLEEVRLLKKKLVLLVIVNVFLLYHHVIDEKILLPKKKTDQWRFRCKRDEARAGD